jgi:hypothetical protein
MSKRPREVIVIDDDEEEEDQIVERTPKRPRTLPTASTIPAITSLPTVSTVPTITSSSMVPALTNPPTSLPATITPSQNTFTPVTRPQRRPLPSIKPGIMIPQELLSIIRSYEPITLNLTPKQIGNLIQAQGGQYRTYNINVIPDAYYALLVASLPRQGRWIFHFDALDNVAGALLQNTSLYNNPAVQVVIRQVIWPYFTLSPNVSIQHVQSLINNGSFEIEELKLVENRRLTDDEYIQNLGTIAGAIKRVLLEPIVERYGRWQQYNIRVPIAKTLAALNRLQRIDYGYADTTSQMTTEFLAFLTSNQSQQLPLRHLTIHKYVPHVLFANVSLQSSVQYDAPFNQILDVIVVHPSIRNVELINMRISISPVSFIDYNSIQEMWQTRSSALQNIQYFKLQDCIIDKYNLNFLLQSNMNRFYMVTTKSNVATRETLEQKAWFITEEDINNLLVPSKPRLYLDVVIMGVSEDTIRYDIMELPQVYFVSYLNDINPQKLSTHSVVNNITKYSNRVLSDQELLEIANQIISGKIANDTELSEFTIQRFNAYIIGSTLGIHLLKFLRIIKSLRQSDMVTSKPIFRIIFTPLLLRANKRYVVTDPRGLVQLLKDVQGIHGERDVYVLISIEWKDNANQPWCYNVDTGELAAC